MSKMIFINLPVTNLEESTSLYSALGFAKNPGFSDETTSCMVWSEAINVMLMTHAKWATFTKRPIPATTSSEVMLALTCEDRAAVDKMNEIANANGGKADINAKQDMGFLYNRCFADLDGHVWEAVWVDPAAFPHN